MYSPHHLSELDTSVKAFFLSPLVFSIQKTYILRAKESEQCINIASALFEYLGLFKFSQIVHWSHNLSKKQVISDLCTHVGTFGLPQVCTQQ